MRTDEFDFDLPREFIAQHPVEPRDAARLLEVGRELTDHTFRDLPALLKEGDILVLNDTRVIPTRLTGRRGEARIEVTLHRAVAAGHWRAFARPAKRLKPGDRIDFTETLSAEVTDKGSGGEVGLGFNLAGQDLRAALECHGAMPLPPYIRRGEGPDPQDRSDYQTVFARTDGAVAAPTAGLHFSEALLEALTERGVAQARLTLHVGAGTFLPVKCDEAEDHVMHPEAGVLTAETVAAVEDARAKGGRVVAVGSTALRLLESAADESGRLHAFEGETDIYIMPGYRFRVVDMMVTNFHLPRSTLFMLVAAFSGLQRMQAAYEHAKQAGYRFYSYGDACLLHREDRL